MPTNTRVATSIPNVAASPDPPLARLHKITATPTIVQRALYLFARALMRAIYRVQIHGLENLPSGGFLLLPNHITWVDALILQFACPRKIRFVIDQEFYEHRVLHPIMRIAGAIPINARRAKDAVRIGAEAMRNGEIVCLFPEGQLE